MTLANFRSSSEAEYVTIPGQEGMEVRDLGLGAPSEGVVAGIVVRAAAGHTHAAGPWHMHNLALQVGYIISGWIDYEFEGVGRIRVQAGTAIYHLPRNRLRILDRSDDFEGVWIKGPAKDEAVLYTPGDTELVPVSVTQVHS